MKSRLISVLLLLFFFVSPQTITAVYGASFEEQYIHIKIVDAETGSPVPGATIILWDLNALERPRFGRGIYLTDDDGECYITGSYVVPGHTYRLYAYRGNLTEMTVDYVPTSHQFTFEIFEKSVDISLRLIPGASIFLNGTIYAVEATGLGNQFSITVIDPESDNPPDLGVNYLNRYDGISEWFTGSTRRFVMVPANRPIKLRVQAGFYSREKGFTYLSFIIDDDGMPFNLTQKSNYILDLSKFSLRRGYGVVNDRLGEASNLLDEAQSVGFMIFNERHYLFDARSKVMEAETFLNKGLYNSSWASLREAFMDAELISKNVGFMRLISVTNAVYLPAVLAVFAVILAFFLFEDERRKLISSVAVYLLFLTAFYWIYPGTRLIMSENSTLFLESAILSLAGTLLVIFGVPRVWRERSVEGEVSLRSALSIIFSMGKRQIRRKKIRGFFTIFSVALLVLAFTSLTSFGSAYGIVSKSLNVTPHSNGILVKRLMNETSLISLPLGYGDPDLLSQILDIKCLTLRVENTPSIDPIAHLVNPSTEESMPIYGILGIDPSAELLFTGLDQTVVRGRYLEEDMYDEVLIGVNLAEKLGVNVGDNVSLYVSGVSGLIGRFEVAGLLDDAEYMDLTDLDGQPYGPLRITSDGTLRVCNSTELIVMNWRAARELQEKANALMEGAPQIAVLSEIIFQPATWDIDALVRTLIFTFEYDVFVSFNGAITHYYIGYRIETKGAVELIIPLIMAGLNIGAVMLNAVYERRKEIRVLSMLGLNPAHIASTFVAEAIIIGMVGGGLGYLFGLGFYRIMSFFGQGLMVREKLEWWWSAIGFIIAIAASVLSALRPALLAVRLYTPSAIRKIKLPEREKEARREKIFKAYQAKELSMPVKVKPVEKPFFFNYFLNRLDELRAGSYERIENIKEEAEIENVKGELITKINFDYILTVSGEKRGTRNKLIGIKSPKEDFYRIRLHCAPANPGTPENMIDRTIDFVHTIIIDWVKNKKKIIGV